MFTLHPMMPTPNPISPVREKAEAEMAKQQLARAVTEMTRLLRSEAEAVALVRSIKSQIQDFEDRIADGTF